MVYLLLFMWALCVISAVIKFILAVKAPNAHAAWIAEEDRKRERRNAALKSGLGLAMKFMKR